MPSSRWDAALQLPDRTALADARRRFAALVAVDRLPISAEAPTVRQDGVTATLRLYDPIDSYGGTWGVSAKEMAAAIDELPDEVTDIRLLINSPGGEVFEGIAILNVLRGHKAKVTAVVEGIAASSASFIACGVDACVMAPNSEMFVHNAWGLCVGDAIEMQKMSDDLAHISDNIASIYAAKAGGYVADWRAVMAAESWYSADEAIAAGLADALDTAKTPEDAAAAKARHDLTVFNLAGRKAIDASATPPSPRPSGQEGASITMDLTKLRSALGVAEDITDDQFVAWLEGEATATPEPTTAPPIPDGHVVVPEARLRDLETGAKAGVEAAEKLRAQERTAFLDGVRTKFAPANRAAWEKEYDRDPEGTRTHFDSAPELVPVALIGTEVHDLDADHDHDALYPKQEVKV